MAEQFTEAETRVIEVAKQDIRDAKRRIRRVEDARRAREKEAAAKAVAARWNKTRDNKIRAALLEMTNTAKTYGMKFDAPLSGFGMRQPFTKLHVTNVHGEVEVVQIYIKHDGFEW